MGSRLGPSRAVPWSHQCDSPGDYGSRGYFREHRTLRRLRCSIRGGSVSKRELDLGRLAQKVGRRIEDEGQGQMTVTHPEENGAR